MESTKTIKKMLLETHENLGKAPSASFTASSPSTAKLAMALEWGDELLTKPERCAHRIVGWDWYMYNFSMFYHIHLDGFVGDFKIFKMTEMKNSRMEGFATADVEVEI